MNHLLLVLLLLAPSISSASEPAEAESLSLIRLIANPERYHQKRVQVVGYCWLEFEGNALYVAEADLQHSVAKNSVALYFDRPLTDEEWRLSGRYVLLEGRYNSRSGGHFGMRSGQIEEITRAEPWGQQPLNATSDVLEVSVAAAPLFFPDVCEDTAVVVELRVGGNGRVLEASPEDVPDVLRKHSAEIAETAKRWLYRPRRGGAVTNVRVGFAFRVMPAGTPDAQLTPVFHQDHVLVRRTPCR